LSAFSYIHLQVVFVLSGKQSARPKETWLQTGKSVGGKAGFRGNGWMNGQRCPSFPRI
jgi:hypothetical protein